MTKVIISMKDELNGFANIALENSTEIAKRGFLHALAVATPDQLFYSHPQDYSLWLLGNFDTKTGQVDLLVTPVLIVRGEKRV